MVTPCSRRRFLKYSATLLLSGMVPMPAWASVFKTENQKRSLSFYHTHTGESLQNAVYFDGGRYQPDALQAIFKLLRDHRTSDIKPIDHDLLDLLHRLSTTIDSTRPFHIISGYRSPATNTMLRKKSRGVARTSYHLLGKAVDIRLPGVKTSTLRQHCIALKAGGVGYYPNSDFVHVDTGPVRNW